AGTWLASAARMISEPSRRISACSNPTALLAASSERNEFEHTSSARPSVRWASVIRPGRISWMVTGMPDWAPSQAASEPARPAPTTCTDSEDLKAVMTTEVARFPAQWNAASILWIRQRPQRSGRYPFVSQPKLLSADSHRPRRAECPNDRGRYRPVHDRRTGTLHWLCAGSPGTPGPCG